MFDRLRSSIVTLERCARELQTECLDGTDAAELVEVVGRGERVCAAMKTLLARRVAETGVWRDEGHRSAGHWLAEKSGVTVGAAQQALDSARAMEELASTELAFRAGELSATQAAEITAAAGVDPEAEELLLEAAKSSSVKGLRDRAREVRAGAQPDDETWARQLQGSRYARGWTDPDGAYRIDAKLPPESGAKFLSAWNAHIDRIFAEARKAGRRESRHAYAADALVALATEGPCKPIDVKLLADAAGIERGFTEPGERCELTGIGPIPVATARRLLADARVSLLVRNGSEVQAVGRPVRTIPAVLRRELETRYPVCGVKGCDNDRFLEIDHVVPVAEGGKTTRKNAWRICAHHHVLKTYCGWVVIGAESDWDLVPPDAARAPP